MLQEESGEDSDEGFVLQMQDEGDQKVVNNAQDEDDEMNEDY